MLDRIVDGDENRETTGEVRRPAAFPIFTHAPDIYVVTTDQLHQNRGVCGNRHSKPFPLRASPGAGPYVIGDETKKTCTLFPRD